MEEKLLRRPDVEKLTGIKCSTIYAKIKQMKFPKQHRYGGTACWKMSEIQEYIDKGEEYVHQKLLKQKELKKVS
ncbi:AlpA family phage regulatory protein [Aliarcobacter butzleri]|uniref:helix-turn-helix transcriptional regulator n=1 Tax=Aliarcobacter butzleri TaxID=28197 RepID=UPI0021B40CEE|nr:AlpA family phage regulatory protein [Aliarcobacter butzleri]MCT7584633.1 AlpA family phage regulatory protein [Aliarcobacter butzleri]